MGGFFLLAQDSQDKGSSHATCEIKDFRLALIKDDEDLMPLTPVRSDAAHIPCAPSEGREEP
jgi:hypothetical protein